ncbi:hypothetical protein BY996DRAFT_8683527 [Phakopsora pachyrhizi]|nr:hypothetical protein BY996DRAFT_8683527 [Phakopsora pachyrhizi]
MHPTNQQKNPGWITSPPNGGHRTDWATQINQDLTVEEELVTFAKTDGVSSAESSPDCGTEELVNVCQPGVSHLIGKISLALTTPATSLSLALPNSSINTHFESQPIVSVTPAPKATVDCARALLFASPPSVMAGHWQLIINVRFVTLQRLLLFGNFQPHVSVLGSLYKNLLCLKKISFYIHHLFPHPKPSYNLDQIPPVHRVMVISTFKKR